jgi:DNA-binding CsgD family transcriptional regulator
MLQRMAEIESSIYAVYDLHKCNYLLKSDEQIRIFGTDNNYGQEISSEMHYKNIHPDDLAFVLETDIMVHQFYSEIEAEEKKNYKLVYDFRTRNVEGFYVRHMHQSIVIELDKNGKSWLTLVISHLLSDRAENEKPQRHLINFKTGKLHLFDKIDGLNSREILTKREKEILSLIGRGYDSINISDKLNISINTVNNHRQNILRKTKTDNTTQAVLYCKRLGFL